MIVLTLRLETDGWKRQAKDVLQRAAAISQATLGEMHHDYSTILTNLAFALKGLGEFTEAEALLKKALKIDEVYFGRAHVEIGHDLWNLACFQIERGRSLEGEGFLRRALKIFETGLGPDHFQTKNIHQAISLVRVNRALDQNINKRRAE